MADTFKAARKLFSPDDEFWDDPILWRAWLDLVQMAAFRTSEIKRAGVKVKVARGQCFVSVRFLAKRWNISIGKTHRFLSECVELGRITIRAVTLGERDVEREPEHPQPEKLEHVGTLITVCKYGEYQDEADTTGTPQRRQRGTRCGTRTGTNIKEVTDRDSSNEESEVFSNRACENWRDRMGGTAPRVRINVALRPLVVQHGAEEVLKWWDKYLSSSTAAQFKTPENFAQRFGAWRREHSTNGCSVEDIRRCLHLGGSLLAMTVSREDGFTLIRDNDPALWERAQSVLPRLDFPYLLDLAGNKNGFELDRAIKNQLEPHD